MPSAFRPAFLAVLLLSIVALGGCHRNVTQEGASLPPPPSLSAPIATTTPTNVPAGSPPGLAQAPGSVQASARTKPLYEETGTASWYGAPYHNRRGSNGELYNMNAMTAAHLTLPLGAMVQVTNVKTNRSAVVRITDRGPFVTGRVLDLSLAAAKALDVYGPGVAKVHIEVLSSPTPLDSGGRWAVQIGAFKEEKTAAKLVDQLKAKYQSAKVIKFLSPVGTWWVRVRVQQDDRKRATNVAHETQVEEGTVFLVRLN